MCQTLGIRYLKFIWTRPIIFVQNRDMGLFSKKSPKKEPELTIEQVEREVLGEPIPKPIAPPTPTVLGHEIPRRRISQPEWEYKTVFESGWDYQTSSEDVILNSYGMEGWELVQIRDATYDLQSNVIFTFKRRIG